MIFFKIVCVFFAGTPESRKAGGETPGVLRLHSGEAVSFVFLGVRRYRGSGYSYFVG